MWFTYEPLNSYKAVLRQRNVTAGLRDYRCFLAANDYSLEQIPASQIRTMPVSSLFIRLPDELLGVLGKPDAIAAFVSYDLKAWHSCCPKVQRNRFAHDP
jgi:hypothetical protein